MFVAPLTFSVVQKSSGVYFELAAAIPIIQRPLRSATENQLLMP